MTHARLFRVQAVAIAAAMMLGASHSARAAATITYVGVIYDQTEFQRLNVGNTGHWFPQFDAVSPVEGRPTGENARDALPTWAGPLNHATSSLDPTFATRTFSQDGPARSKGGQADWNAFTLPNDEAGLSGAIVDPATRGNSNNTINRIQLNAGVPSTFYFHVVTDNTGFAHDPINRVRVRGNAGGIDVEANTYPKTANLAFDGVADVYTFRFDGFAPGDYIKLQLNGAPAPKQGASFGGFLFDDVFAPTPVLHGDFNVDGVVDAADYVTWRKNDGAPTGYVTWRANYNRQNGSGSSFKMRPSPAVPEPASILLVSVAGCILIQLRFSVRSLRKSGS